MSEAAVLPIVEEVAGRSLWADARTRLTRNRAAVASMAVLALIALACLVGPLATGHPYDRVYQDYVRVPASVAPHPQPEQIVPAAERIAARIRARAEDARVEGDALRLVLVAPRPIDERLLAFFDRSDLFGPAQILDRADDGRRLSIEAPIERRRFLFGTDANGRDLLTRTLVA
ncbi:MAG: ABC transporter permease, partial [Microvirga sp.]